MTRYILFIGCLLICRTLLAETPPQSYQQLKAEFAGLKMEKEQPHHPTLTKDQKLWIGIGVGAAAFAVTEYFMITDQRGNYHKALYVGAGVHLATHLYLMAVRN